MNEVPARRAAGERARHLCPSRRSGHLLRRNSRSLGGRRKRRACRHLHRGRQGHDGPRCRTRRRWQQSRVVEAERSGEVLGASGTSLPRPSRRRARERHCAAARTGADHPRARPEAIISPDPLAVFFGEHHYNHRDHRVVGWAALDAAAPAAALPLYFRGTGTAHQVTAAYLSGSLEPNVWVDVSIDHRPEDRGGVLPRRPSSPMPVTGSRARSATGPRTPGERPASTTRSRSGGSGWHQ